jgi:4-amino-4-deoxy-L-arabinose transferase-like glycosyltransferase
MVAAPGTENSALRAAKLRAWLLPAGLGLAAWLAVVLTRMDPGLTADEPFNVFYGKDFVSQLLDLGGEFFRAPGINQTFASHVESRQHPPLGRWMIGWMHWLGDSAPRDPGALDFHAARIAPATAFAITVMLVTRASLRRRGTIAGATAGVALVLMPRVFAHAHFAALDTMMSWTYLMGILSAGWMMQGPRPLLRTPLAGLLLGCALLTKLHGFFLFPLVGAWCVVFYGWRGLLPLVVWTLIGLATFFAGWQWLWLDLRDLLAQAGIGTVNPDVPFYALERLWSFLYSGVERDRIYVWYFGAVHADTQVPWHYPWVLFAVTVPVGLHALGLCGVGRQLRRGWSDPFGWLLLAAVAFPLVVFSVPSVPVYDGVRMFLMAFPVWALFVGRGAAFCVDSLRSRRMPPWAAVASLTAFLAAQGYGVLHYHPFQLSYYNMLTSDAVRHPMWLIDRVTDFSRVKRLTSGVRGAEELGLEVTYWGDAVTPALLDRWSQLAPPGACAHLAPTLYASHPLLYQTDSTVRRGQRLVAPGESDCRYVIVYNRQAYLCDEFQRVLRDGEPLAANRVDGVVLAAVYARSATPNQSQRTPREAESP